MTASSSRSVACKFCTRPITWMRRGEAWVPRNGDGSQHACDEFAAARSAGPSFSAKMEQAYARGLAEGWCQAVADLAPQLTSDELYEVVQLTHPDRHPPERRQLANRVTAKLLGLRREVAA